MNPTAARGWLLALGLFVAACSNNGNKTSPAAASASASAKVLASVGATAALPSAAARPPPACRALRVTGEARLADVPLESGSLLDGPGWVSLGKDGKLTLKHSASGREIAIAGPALFRACSKGREQVLLARGTVTVAAGLGSRPGAEVLIATPGAAVHYADAEFTLGLDDEKLTLAVRAGGVDVDPWPAPAKPLKSPLIAKDKLALSVAEPDAARALAECKVAAEQAQALALRVSDRSAAEPLGQRARAHVRARKVARDTCAVAAAATGLLADPVERARLWAEAERWEAMWETIPRHGRLQAPEK